MGLAISLAASGAVALVDGLHGLPGRQVPCQKYWLTQKDPGATWGSTGEAVKVTVKALQTRHGTPAPQKISPTWWVISVVCQQWGLPWASLTRCPI